jgi:hypothetical protein
MEWNMEYGLLVTIGLLFTVSIVLDSILRRRWDWDLQKSLLTLYFCKLQMNRI